MNNYNMDFDKDRNNAYIKYFKQYLYKPKCWFCSEDCYKDFTGICYLCALDKIPKLI